MAKHIDIYHGRKRKCPTCGSLCTIENAERTIFPCGLALNTKNEPIAQCRKRAA